MASPGDLFLGGGGPIRVILDDIGVIVNASARPPRLAGLPTVGTCNYRYTGI